MPTGPGLRGRVGGACASRPTTRPASPGPIGPGLFDVEETVQMVIVMAAAAGDADLAEVVRHV